MNALPLGQTPRAVMVKATAPLGVCMLKQTSQPALIQYHANGSGHWFLPMVHANGSGHSYNDFGLCSEWPLRR